MKRGMEIGEGGRGESSGRQDLQGGEASEVGLLKVWQE